MLTFIALRHQKMLLRWRSVLHTDGGWGDVNVHCILSSENVVTLKIGVAYRCGVGVGGMLLFIALRHQKMLLRWRCCYVQGNVNLKMLLRWRCCTGLVHLGMLSKWLCGCEEKKKHVHFAHGSLVDYDMFMSIKRNLKFQKTHNSYGKSKNDTSWWTWKKNFETADNISRIWCPHVELIPDILTL